MTEAQILITISLMCPIKAKRAGRNLYTTGKLSFVEEGMIYYFAFDCFYFSTSIAHYLLIGVLSKL